MVDKVNQQNTCEKPRWIEVESATQVPLGNWLVKVDDAKKPIQTIERLKTLILVGDYFHWDKERVIAYYSLPLEDF